MNDMLAFIKKYSYCFYEQDEIIMDILNLAPKLYDNFDIPDQPSLLNWDKLHLDRVKTEAQIQRNFYNFENDKTTTVSYNFELTDGKDDFNKLIDVYFETVVEIFSGLAEGLGINKDVNTASLSYNFLKYYKRNPTATSKKSYPHMGMHKDNKTFSLVNSTHPGLVSRDDSTGKWMPLFRTPKTSAIFLGTQQSLYPAREHMVKFFHPKIKTRYSFIVFF
jgi:hypothetical protein